MPRGFSQSGPHEVLIHLRYAGLRESMEYRLLGASGLEVSVLGFGTMTLGGEGRFAAMGNVQVEEARRLVGICIEAGINLFDTADMYSLGKSEEVLGQALGAHRKDIVLATKVFVRLEPGTNKAGLSRRHILEACDASLRRLGTDYIDLYQAHNFDSLTPLDETLRAFDDLIRAGKIRYAGCSNVSVRPTQVRDGEPGSYPRKDSVGRLDSDKQDVPAKMFPGGCRPSTRKCFFQHFQIRHFVHFHENPVWKGTAAEAGDLISQQLDCAVKDSVVMWLHQALLAVIDKPDHPFALDCLPEQRIRLEHPFLFCRSTIAPVRCHPASRGELSDFGMPSLAHAGQHRQQIIFHRNAQPTARLHDRKNRRDLGAGLRAAHVQPVLSAQGYRPHGVLRDIVRQLNFGMIETALELGPHI